LAREYFAAYHSYLKSIETLTEAEIGRLFVACLEYSMTGTEQELRGNERHVYPTIREQIDRDAKAYEGKCETNRNNVLRRYTNVDERIPDDTNVHKEKEKEKEKEKTKEKAREALTRHKHGLYGWVMLSDKEYQTLLFEFGESELDRCIEYVDNSAEKTKNKNGWKSWIAVIRNCHKSEWGLTGAVKQKSWTEIAAEMGDS